VIDYGSQMEPDGSQIDYGSQIILDMGSVDEISKWKYKRENVVDSV